MDGPGPPDRLLQGGTHGWVQPVQRPGQRLGWHPDRIQTNPIEAFGKFDQGRDPVLADPRADRPHLLDGVLDVQRRPGHHGTQGPGS